MASCTTSTATTEASADSSCASLRIRGLEDLGSKVRGQLAPYTWPAVELQCVCVLNVSLLLTFG